MIITKIENLLVDRFVREDGTELVLPPDGGNGTLGTVEYVDNKIAEVIGIDMSQLVTLNTAQTINSYKYFTSGLDIDGVINHNGPFYNGGNGFYCQVRNPNGDLIEGKYNSFTCHGFSWWDEGGDRRYSLNSDRIYTPNFQLVFPNKRNGVFLLREDLPAGEIDNITVSGVVTAANFLQSSDRRLKENIKTYQSKKSILDLDVKEFNFIGDNRKQIGCIAQELQELFPELVVENENGYLAIAENKLVYLLLNEVKTLKARLDAKEG